MGGVRKSRCKRSRRGGRWSRRIPSGARGRRRNSPGSYRACPHPVPPCGTCDRVRRGEWPRRESNPRFLVVIQVSSPLDHGAGNNEKKAKGKTQKAKIRRRVAFFLLPFLLPF